MPPPRRDSGPLRAKTGQHLRKTGPVPASRPQPGSTVTRGTQSPATETGGNSRGGSGAVRAGGSGANRAGTNARSSGSLKTPGARDKGTPARSNTQGGSDRRGNAGGGNPRGARSKPMGLRTKFMLVLAGVTAVVMVMLGLIMSSTANKYLGGQKRHDGVEVARLAAQIVTAVADSMADAEKLDPDAGKDVARYRKRITEYLEDARTWGSLGTDPTDILAVKFNLPEKYSSLSSSGIGPDEQGNADKDEQFHEVFIPKNGSTVRVPEELQIFAGVRKAEGESTPIYRFKVALSTQRFGGRKPEGTDWKSTPYVNVDINASAVNKAQSNLVFAIFFGVVLSIAITIGVANWLAGNITRPLDLLVKDMKIVAQGDLDHETRPHSTDEVGVLANEFNRMTHNLKAAQSALVEQEKAEYELSLAREVQRQLLPANSPEIPGFQCASYYLGAKAVSGDYFDFIDLGNGLWGFIIADVSGKGIPGSMVMAVTRTIVRLIAVQNGARANETLKMTNRLIAKQIKRGMFVTSFYAVLDTRTGQLTYACAGHNPMVIYRGVNRSYELAAGKGIALGFNEGPIFDKTIELHQTLLQRGDGIVLYTDGFPEAMNAKNEEFGDERFYELVPKYGQGDVQTLINGLVGEIAKHRGDAEQSDDLTLLAVRRI